MSSKASTALRLDSVKVTDREFRSGKLDLLKGGESDDQHLNRQSDFVHLEPVVYYKNDRTNIS